MGTVAGEHGVLICWQVCEWDKVAAGGGQGADVHQVASDYFRFKLLARAANSRQVPGISSRFSPHSRPSVHHSSAATSLHPGSKTLW